MGIPSPFVGAIQSPHLWTPHSGCQKTPQSLLLQYLLEDEVNMSEKYGDADAFNLGLPAVPLVQTPKVEAKVVPTTEAQKDLPTLPKLQGTFVVKNTFLQLPGSSNDPSPDFLPRRRSESDWTGLSRADASLFLELGGSVEDAENLGGKYMPEWSLPPAASEEDCAAFFPSPQAAMSTVLSVVQTDNMVWQYCWARPDGEGGTWIVPCDANDPALKHVVLASGTTTPCKSEGKASDEPSTMASSAAEQVERRIDPDDDKAYSLEELRECYSDRFTESQIDEYWECLEVARSASDSSEDKVSLAACPVEEDEVSLLLECLRAPGSTESQDVENLPRDAAAGALKVLSAEAPDLLSVLDAKGFNGFYNKMVLMDDAESFQPEPLEPEAFKAATSQQKDIAYVPQWIYGVCRASDPTTLELQNLPNNFQQAELVALLDAKGFRGLYDFLFVPFNLKTGRSHPYAVVNFTDHSFGLALAAKLQDYSAWTAGTGEACHVEWSKVIQGWTEILEKYRDHASMHESVPDVMRPMLFHDGERVSMPLPTTCLRQPRFLDAWPVFGS